VRCALSLTPADFCKNAQECVEFASRTNNAVHRDLLFDLAVKWLHLAGATRQEMELVRTGGKKSAA
jgi:hypothetical protein